MNHTYGKAFSVFAYGHFYIQHIKASVPLALRKIAIYIILRMLICVAKIANWTLEFRAIFCSVVNKKRYWEYLLVHSCPH